MRRSLSWRGRISSVVLRKLVLLMAGRAMLVASVFVAALLPAVCHGSPSVYMKLTIDGNDVAGESTVASLNRAGTVELLSYAGHVVSPYDQASGLATGRRNYGPITIRKRLDNVTPLLIKALAQNQPVEAQFLFFRPAVMSAGAEEHFMTVEIKVARVVAVSHLTAEVEGAAVPVLEEVQFAFGEIIWTHVPTGATFHDMVGEGRSAVSGQAGGPAPAPARPAVNPTRPPIVVPGVRINE